MEIFVITTKTKFEDENVSLKNCNETIMYAEKKLEDAIKDIKRCVKEEKEDVQNRIKEYGSKLYKTYYFIRKIELY